MIVITNKVDNRIIMMGSSVDILENNCTMLYDNYGNKIIFENEQINIFEVSNIGENISEDKYCYTEADGFYLNPDYVEPDPTNIYGIPDELFNQIKSDYREQITSEVSK